MYFTWEPETDVLTPCDFKTWRKISNRILMQNSIGIFAVSTIFLGIEGKLFEVSLFDTLQLRFLEQYHYATKDEALKAHAKLVAETASYA